MDRISSSCASFGHVGTRSKRCLKFFVFIQRKYNISGFADDQANQIEEPPGEPAASSLPVPLRAATGVESRILCKAIFREHQITPNRTHLASHRVIPCFSKSHRTGVAQNGVSEHAAHFVAALGIGSHERSGSEAGGPGRS